MGFAGPATPPLVKRRTTGRERSDPDFERYECARTIGLVAMTFIESDDLTDDEQPRESGLSWELPPKWWRSPSSSQLGSSLSVAWLPALPRPWELPPDLERPSHNVLPKSVPAVRGALGYDVGENRAAMAERGSWGVKVHRGFGMRRSPSLTVAATGLLVAVVVFGAAEPAWASGRWSIQSNPDPGNIGSDDFYGVSCASTSWCVAVGDYVSNTTLLDLPLIESWNGKDWKVSSSPIPGEGTGDDALYGVSCVSASSCVAVGQYYEANVTNGLLETLIESWNGTNWSITPSPSPGTVNNLNGVSCVSSKSCKAVGAYITGMELKAEPLSSRGTDRLVESPPSPSNGDGTPSMAFRACHPNRASPSAVSTAAPYP